jgi:hypothetical protein
MDSFQKPLLRHKSVISNQSQSGEATSDPCLQREKPCYNFEMHISRHLQAHLDKEKSGVEIRETKKVRYLLELIDAASFNAATAIVRATDRYLESFNLTTTYIQTFIIANEQTGHRNVASVNGTKQVKFDRKNRFNSKQPPAKRMFRKIVGS